MRRALSGAAGGAKKAAGKAVGKGKAARNSNGLRNVVLVDGARLPFQPAMTAYNDLISYDLARLAMTGLMTKTGVSPKEVDYVLMGTVLQEVKTSNLARDAALASGFPKSVPAHTISQVGRPHSTPHAHNSPHNRAVPDTLRNLPGRGSAGGGVS